MCRKRFVYLLDLYSSEIVVHRSPSGHSSCVSTLLLITNIRVFFHDTGSMVFEAATGIKKKFNIENMACLPP